jgi:metallopeptidase MepB
MNLPRATENKPSLLTMDNLRSLFHELGHGLHSLMTVTKYASSHGPVDRDFIEIPSILFEYFLWTEQHLLGISCHYSYLSIDLHKSWKETHGNIENQPPKHLPKDTIRGLLDINQKQSPLSILLQLHFAMYDMKIHSPKSLQELEQMDYARHFNETRNEIMSLKGGESLGEGWDWAYGHTHFRAMVNNYDAGYYTYTL